MIDNFFGDVDFVENYFVLNFLFDIWDFVLFVEVYIERRFFKEMGVIVRIWRMNFREIKGVILEVWGSFE